MITVASSGAEEPAAMKVAPATSGDSLNSGRAIKANHVASHQIARKLSLIMRKYNV